MVEGTRNNIGPALLVGTALMTSIISPHFYQIDVPVPIKTHKMPILHKAFSYEVIDNTLVLNGIQIESEPIIEIPVTKKIKIKLKKSVPLEYICVEDSDGFV